MVKSTIMFTFGFLHDFPIMISSIVSWLVLLTILKNMKVNGKDDIPYLKWKIKDVWNHQPVSVWYSHDLPISQFSTVYLTAPPCLRPSVPALVHAFISSLRTRSRCSRSASATKMSPARWKASPSPEMQRLGDGWGRWRLKGMEKNCEWFKSMFTCMEINGDMVIWMEWMEVTMIINGFYFDGINGRNTYGYLIMFQISDLMICDEKIAM